MAHGQAPYPRAPTRARGVAHVVPGSGALGLLLALLRLLDRALEDLLLCQFVWDGTIVRLADFSPRAMAPQPSGATAISGGELEASSCIRCVFTLRPLAMNRCIGRCEPESRSVPTPRHKRGGRVAHRLGLDADDASAGAGSHAHRGDGPHSSDGARGQHRVGICPSPLNAGERGPWRCNWRLLIKLIPFPHAAQPSWPSACGLGMHQPATATATTTQRALSQCVG